MNFTQQVKEKGVVGAGGAGFPSHVKIAAQAEIVLVNAAECEPLLHKDKQILKHHAAPFFTGLNQVIAQVGAVKGIIGIKRKHKSLIAALRQQLPPGVELCEVDDFYPAGDEITLIRETTGRIVAPGQLPLTQGIIVMNVESLYNCGNEGPVTHKFVNLGGAVRNRHSLQVPLGLSFQTLLEYARPEVSDYVVIEGGPMMGRLVEDFSSVVTKTTAGLLVFPADHILVRKYRDKASMAVVNRVGKSACDQCTYCTELCPRHLLGHPIQPHKAMRSLLFHNPQEEPEHLEQHTLYCCQCHLCSFVSCPEGLYPSQVCISHRAKSIAAKQHYDGPLDAPPHPMAPYRKTPSKKLRQALDLNRFVDEGELVETALESRELRLPLHQHIGVPAEPLVKQGERVSCGQKIATVGEKLGSEIFAPADGVVKSVDEEAVVIAVQIQGGEE